MFFVDALNSMAVSRPLDSMKFLRKLTQKTRASTDASHNPIFGPGNPIRRRLTPGKL